MLTHGHIHQAGVPCPAGLQWDGSKPSWEDMWRAITAVWASKWNARAESSMRKAGLQHSPLQMAVLCQPVVPARYAFVAHTSNPITRARLLEPPRPSAACIVGLSSYWSIFVMRPCGVCLCFGVLVHGVEVTPGLFIV